MEHPSSSSPPPQFTTLRIDINLASHVGELVLSRGEQLNTMTPAFFEEFGRAVDYLWQCSDVNVILVWAEGRMFTAGLDLKEAASILTPATDGNRSAAATALYKHVLALQASFSRLNHCPKPVVAAVHGKCLGGGVDLITAADIRFASADASFAVLETKLAIVADLGTLQRLERIVGPGVAREMAFSSDAIDSARALSVGLVSRVLDSKEKLLTEARAYATKVAALSPLVVQGTKLTLNFAAEHRVSDGLQQVALWNTAFLQSEDLVEAVGAHFARRPPAFRNRL